MGDQIIQPIYRIDSPQEIRSPLFNLRKIPKADKSTAESCRTHSNLMNNEKSRSFKFQKLKDVQLFCRIGSPQEIRSPLFNLKKFLKTYKRTAESCRTHSNLMNGREFWSFKFLKLKYRMGKQMMQPFYRIGSPQQVGSPLLNLTIFQKNEKDACESFRIHWNLMNDQEFE